MGPLAFSLPGEVEAIGALAGFASLLGIAILALMYFAQAREVKRLREWAGRAPERAQELEQRVAAQLETAPARRAEVPADVAARPATAAAQSATPPPPPADAPRVEEAPSFAAAPAGMGAPAMASATRFAPPSAPEPTLEPPEPAGEEPTVVARPPGPAVPAAMTAVARPAPATGAPAATNGHGEAPSPLRRATPGGVPGRPVRAIGGARPAGGVTVPPPPAERAAPRRRRPWILVLVVVALLALAGGAFAVVRLVSKDDGATPPRATATGGTAGQGTQKNGSKRSRRGPAAFSRGSVTVTVLNGTPVSGLASRVANDLDAAGFKQGSVTNASDQARSATIVSFLPGQRRQAVEVAKVLKGAAVEPMDATTRAIACPAPNPCRTTVVTVGSDRAR
jgi:LytR cell envelope-related transcriptional attenuator